MSRTGGAMAWLMWGLGALFFSYAFFHRVAPSVMIDDLMRDFAVGGAILGNLSAFYFYSYVALQIPVGLLVDKWGPRRVLGAAALLCAAGSLTFALAQNLNVAYLGRLMIGAGAAFPWVGCLALAAAWFPPRRFALLTGLTVLAGMLGGMFGQGPIAALVVGVGWRATMGGAAALALVLAAAIWLVVRDRPAAAAAAGPAPAEGSVLAGLRQVAGSRQTWLLAMFGAALSAPMLAFGALWSVPYFELVHGISRPAAAFTASMMLMGWAVGGPLAGWVSDRIGRRRWPMVGGIALALVSLTAVLHVPDLSLTAVRALMFTTGLFSGPMVVAYATIREHNPAGAGGTAYGMLNMGVMASGAVFQPVIGWLLDLNWDGTMVAGARVYTLAAYNTAFLVLPVILAVGVGAALLVRETWCRPVGEPAPAT